MEQSSHELRPTFDARPGVQPVQPEEAETATEPDVHAIQLLLRGAGWY